jgi:integrase
MSVYKRPGSPFFWCQFFVKGTRIRESTGQTTRKEAQAVERQRRAELEAAARGVSEPRRTSTPTLRKLADDDIERARQSTTPEHTHILSMRWDRVLLELDAEFADEITAEVLAKYISSRRGARIAGQTIRRELADVRRILTAGGFPVPTPWPKVKSSPKNVAQAGKVHAAETIVLVLEAVPEDVRDACFVVLNTGLRFAELKRVRWSWVEAAQIPGAKISAILRAPADSTKSRRERLLGLNEETYKLLQRRHETCGEVLFPRAGYRKALARACERLNIQRTVTLRDLRHAFATKALKNSGDLAAVSKALGHASVATTALYLHAGDAAAVNLATVLQPHSDRSHKAKQRKISKQNAKVERETGLEPATPSLGRSDPSANSNFMPAPAAEKCNQIQTDTFRLATLHSHTGHRGHTTPVVLEASSDWEIATCKQCGKEVKLLTGEVFGRCARCGGELGEAMGVVS